VLLTDGRDGGEIVSPEELVVAWGTEYPVDNTRLAYETDLTDYMHWCADRDIDPLKPDRLEVNAYRVDLLSRGLLPQSVDRKMSACRSFFAYLGGRGMLRGESPFGHVGRLAANGESTTPWLGAGELTRLLEAALEASPRDFLLVSLLGINGLRVSEAISAVVEDLGEADSLRTLRVVRKGAREGLTPLSAPVVGVLDAYLADRTRGPLLARLDRHRRVQLPVSPITRQTAYERIRELAGWAGVNRAISPHSLRHGFITAALEGGAELHVVQLAVGHASPTTTMRYRRGGLNLNHNPSLGLGEQLLKGVVDGPTA
jgi:site-specific recombinase XerD